MVAQTQALTEAHSSLFQVRVSVAEPHAASLIGAFKAPNRNAVAYVGFLTAFQDCVDSGLGVALGWRHDF